MLSKYDFSQSFAIPGRVRDEHALTRRAHDRRARAGDGRRECAVVTCRPYAAGQPLPPDL